MNFIKKNLCKLVMFSFALLAPFFKVLAQAAGNAVTTHINNPINVGNLTDLIKTILTGVIKIGIPIVALALIYSGFLFVFAQGKSDKLTIAKNALLYSLIGAAILLGSWAIAQLISNTVLAL